MWLRGSARTNAPSLRPMLTCAMARRMRRRRRKRYAPAWASWFEPLVPHLHPLPQADKARKDLEAAEAKLQTLEKEFEELEGAAGEVKAAYEDAQKLSEAKVCLALPGAVACRP